MASTDMGPTFTPEVARATAEMQLQSLEYELPATKKVILAITNPDFRIDPKSRTAIEIASHLVTVDVQMLEDIANLKFEMEERHTEVPKTVDAMVEWYDKNLALAAVKVRSMTDEQLVTPINFFGMFNFPAFMYIAFAVKHSVHHRGFLAAYLRPMGSKVPSIYGPTADEPMQM
jgi:uncharacterized damage-inducible protein DinB